MKFLSSANMLDQMRNEIEKKSGDDEGLKERASAQRFVTAETFENFAEVWKKYLISATDEVKKKIIHKLVKRIEIGKNEVTIEWLIDEDHYKEELALGANSSFSEVNRKNFLGCGSQSLINGAYSNLL